MVQTVLGVVARSVGAAVEVAEIVIPDPGPGEAVVRVQACGVCHTDANYRDVGAALWTGAVDRGDTVAVIGCAGVGSAAVAGARIAGAEQIIAVDTDRRRLGWARKFGATHTVDARTAEPVPRIRELTGGHGADVVIDAIGRLDTWKQAFYSRDTAGTVVLLGVPTPDIVLDIPLLDLRVGGGALKSAWYGNCLPSRDFPFLVALYRQGHLDLDAFITETIPLDQVEAAFQKLRNEEVLRSVVVL
ncbi:zinc-binding dehydrogenase [Nocardia brasiliensis]|uniref:zinc-binding dehydrogenase n=1 Tax=Nocardia brasiliensis TaxID=37326 RepID=UPI002456A5DC|nr:zinc-binding dehydrogenase [Nocardia brasiliensis]